ncbi:MAG: hypothetical protein IJ244_00930 [Bacteroidaceae bacterium]|nr:hypothetical protein [Bacteroidaceae bacterium]
MNMRHKFIIPLLFIMFSFGNNATAQTYASLWKEVETAQQKDLPQQALKSIDQLIRQAIAKEDGGWLLKGLLYRRQLSYDISPDSAAVIIPRLEHLLEQQPSAEMTSLLHLTLGVLYKNENATLYEDAPKQAVAHFRQSMESPPLLAKAQAEKYIPFVVKGSDSKLYGHDLLSIVATQAADELCSMNAEPLQTHDLGLQLLQEAIDTYQQQGNHEAVLMMKLKQTELSQTWGEKRKAAYQQLIQEYGDLPLITDAYLHLAEEMGNAGKEAYLTLMEGIDRHPKGKRTNLLRNRIKSITQPRLSLSLERKQAYTGQEVSMNIQALNVTKAHLRFYRSSLTAESETLRNLNQEKLKDLAKQTALDIPLQIAKGEPYEEIKTTAKLNAPQKGIYIVALEGEHVKSSYELFYVSDLHIMQLPLQGQSSRVVVSEAQSGKPVAGTKVTVRTNDRNRRIIQALITDEKGEAILKEEPSANKILFAVKDNDAYCLPLQVHRLYGNGTERTTLIKTLSLYTDRAIYRPGQKVKVGGFNYSKQEDQLSVIAGDSISLRLLDANRKEIGKLQVVTDAFGTIGAEFDLPSSCLNGQFCIQGNNGSVYFRVEQYKRPTFTVTFDAPAMAYQAGDTVRLTGTVKTYAGFPLQNTRVAINVSRRYSPWCYTFYGQPKQMASDTLNTDADGKFSIPVYLDIQDQEAEQLNKSQFPRFYIFETEAVATSENGESETGSYRLFAGNKPSFLSTTLPSRLCKENASSFQVNQLNAGGQPLDGQAYYEIALGSEVKASGQWPFNQQMSPSIFDPLPSNEYTLRIWTNAEKRNSAELEHRFALFSLSDTKPVGNEPLQIYQTSDQFSAGQVQMLMATPVQDAYIHYDLFSQTEHLENRIIPMSDSALTKVYSYKEDYGNGLQVVIAFVKEGQMHTQSVTIRKPIPNKQLSLRWKVFRDRLHPGQNETWTLQVLREGKPTEASLMATLYDASLDKFQTLHWPMSLYFNRTLPHHYWNGIPLYQLGFSFAEETTYLKEPEWQFSHFDIPLSQGRFDFVYRSTGKIRMNKLMAAAATQAMVTESVQDVDAAPVALNALEEKSAGSSPIVNGRMASVAEVRSNFAETAFFQPALTTDEQGEVNLTFTLPQSLTQWNFKALAHSKLVDYGFLDTTVVATKDLMIQPNIPRFLRVGDQTSLAASVRNATDQILTCTVTMEVRSAQDDKILISQQQLITIQALGETTVTFPITATEGHSLLICRMVADAGQFSDGEQHYIPILSDRQEITQSIPLSLTQKGRSVVALQSLFNEADETATHRRITIEYSGNPAWMAIEALPSLAKPVNNNAISMATAYYALSLASLEAKAHPSIARLAQEWKKAGEPDSLFLFLERNEDLKQIILSETPWVSSADRNRERLMNLANLFDETSLAYRTHSYLDKLLELQNADGSWSWFKGMSGSFWITTDICETLARLAKIYPEALSGKAEQHLQSGIRYLDAQVTKDVAEMKKLQAKQKAELHLGMSHLRYLYICTLMAHKMQDEHLFLIKLLEQGAPSYAMYEKSLAAIILSKAGREKAARLTLQSLLEHTVTQTDMGRYFDTQRAAMSWQDYRIPTQVATLDALYELTPNDTLTIQEMTRWLLQAKRTQSWDTPSHSVDALYHLFLHQRSLNPAGGIGLPKFTLSLTPKGHIDLSPEAEDVRLAATLGYYRHTLQEEELKGQPQSLTISKVNDPMSFGAVYAQYLIPTSAVKAEAAGLSLTCNYSVRRGQEWKPIDQEALQVGDLIRIRYEINSDRDYDFVCLKEGRPACLEPCQPLSGYDWRMGCYRDVGDASTCYFFHQVYKGKHVLESELRIDRSGLFTSAVPTIQCVYSPEFFGHAQGITLKVK